jgi:ribosomal protein S2
MQNNIKKTNQLLFTNHILDLLNNKYFFITCFYIRKKCNASIYNSFFIGYKFKYLVLNINILIKSLKRVTLFIQKIIINNGKIMILPTSNKIINYIIYQNCKNNNMIYYFNILEKHLEMNINIVKYMRYFPDLIICLDYNANSIFLNKIKYLNIPLICFTDILYKDLIFDFYFLIILNTKSFYSYFIILYIIMNTINNCNKIYTIIKSNTNKKYTKNIYKKR